MENGPSAARAPSNSTSQNIFRGVSTTGANGLALGGAWDLTVERLTAGGLRGRWGQALREFDVRAPGIGDVGDPQFRGVGAGADGGFRVNPSGVQGLDELID